MTVYDVIPTAEDLMAKAVSHDNELQAMLVQDVVQFLNSSKQYFERGLEVTFYPKPYRDNGEYSHYWMEHRQDVADDLNKKGYVTVVRGDSSGLFISLPKIEIESEEPVHKPRQPIKRSNDS